MRIRFQKRRISSTKERVERSWCEKVLWPPETDQWLAIFRIGLGLLVIAYCLSLRKDWTFLFGETKSGGLNFRPLSEAMVSLESPLVPRLGWLVSIGQHVGMNETTVLSAAWTLLLLTGITLMAGFFCRASAILAWFLHLSAVKSGDLFSYGVDTFISIGLFYLMISPLPDRYSLDARLRGMRPKPPELLGFFRRVLQIHLCLIYFFSGLTKCLGVGWWNGSSLWRVLTRPPFNRIPPEWLIQWKSLVPIGGIVICLLELGFPFLIWTRKIGRIWLVSICAMHLMIGFAMSMYLFALTMIVLNLAAFGVAPASDQADAAIDAESAIDEPVAR